MLTLSATRAPAEESDPPATESPVLVAPRLLHDPGVSYPEAALAGGYFEQARVELVLTIAADGTVTRAVVEGPGQPLFDAPALAAAQQLLFEPARKHGLAVSARIRFRYLFEAPPPLLSAHIVDDPTGRPVVQARVSVRLADGSEIELEPDLNGELRSDRLPRGSVEVLISAANRLPQQTRVELTPGKETRIEVRLVAEPFSSQPDAKPAPERAIEVTVRGEKLAPAVSSFSRAEVRQMPGAFGDPFRAIEALPGVTPMASGFPFFYVRGAPPGNVGYFVNGVRIPFLYHVAIGPSVIHPGLIDRVDLYPGGYPASFGRFAGGIVSAETTTARPDTHGEANVRLFDAGVLVETGFHNGRGTLLLGGRYSYTATLLSLVVPDLKLDYRDYQACITYDITDRDRLSLLGLGSYDLLAQKQSGGLDVLFGAEFYRLSLGHMHTFDAGTLTTSVTLGYDQSLQSDQGKGLDRSLAARTELRHALGSRALLRAGAEVSLDGYSTARPHYVDPDSPEFRSFQRNNPGRTDQAASAYCDVVLRPAPGVEITPGVRLDWYGSLAQHAVGIDPRIAARFRISNRLTLIHADGIVHQLPSYALPLPGRAPAGLAGGLQKSIQTSAGAEVDLGAGTLVTATLFYNAFFNMTDTFATTSIDGPPDSHPPVRSLGSAIGLEAYLRRRLTQRLGGFVSYTLSRSMRSIGNERFPSAFDRTHVVNAALAYDLGRNWRAGTRLVFYTGAPVAVDSRVITPRRTESPEREHAFLRLDLRLEKRWNLSRTTWLSFVAEVMNATLSKEKFGNQEIGPLTIPSLGAEIGF